MSYDVYGNDIMLSNGDIVTTNNGDMYTSKDYEQKIGSLFDGYYNMLFSIMDRLLTPAGDNVFHPEYGSAVIDLLSKPNTANLATYLSDEIKSVLLKDDRIKEVKSVKVTQKGNIVNAQASVVLVGSNTVTEFVFPHFVTE